MVDPAATPRPVGPLERTVLELGEIARAAAFRRARLGRSRRRVRESDDLMRRLEDCRVRGLRLLPVDLWSAVVRLVGDVDASLRDALGINRQLDHVGDILFEAQAILLAWAEGERQPRMAPIIPLFPPPSEDPGRAEA